MANRGWLLAGVLAVICVGACNSDKPSPFATKPAAAGSAGSGAIAGSAAPTASAGSATATAASTAPAASATAVDAGLIEEPLQVGETVWTRAEAWGDNHARRGKIVKINANGTYRLSFTDTDDADMDAASLSRTKAMPPAVTGLQVGDRVDGLWSDNRWYPGKVGAVNADGTYAINFDDGDKAALDAHHVRRRKVSTGHAASTKAGGKPCNEGNYYTRCDEYHCFNLNQDDHNCGACGHQCPKTARTCVNSQCKCLSGSYDSDGDCI